jgi:hypothetical protein
VFPGEAQYSDGRHVRFVVIGTPDETFSNVLDVWGTGRVQLRWPLTPSANSGGQPQLSAVEIAKAVWVLAAATRRGAYRRLFGRILPRRLDWQLGVSPDILDASNVRQPWIDIAFPGRRPEGRATGQLPIFGGPFLSSRREYSDPSQVVAGCLRSFLRANGYRSTDFALTDAVRALRPAE